MSNWPLIDYAISWGAGPNDSPVQDLWCSVTSRTEGKTAVRRGKQYELDQVQPGEMTLTLRNLDGAFDPTNTGSPFYPQVKPYRLIRLRAQYPATVNLLTADQATAFYASKGAGGAGSTLPQWVAQYGTGCSVSIGSATGINYYAVTVNASAVDQGVRFAGFSTAAGLTYTAQCQANTGSSGMSVQLVLDWRDCNGNHLSYTTGTAVALPATFALTPVTVTGTAPANACGAYLILQNTVANAGSTSYAAEKFQIEQNSTASAYAQPGTWYSLFTGYVERWPQTWTSGGNYGVVNLNCVDRFAFFANFPLSYAAYTELAALLPSWFYPLDEPSGATKFHDETGNVPPASLTIGLGNTASVGAQLTSTGGYTPIGIPGPVVTLNTTTTGDVVTDEIVLPNGGPPHTAAWTRVYAFNVGTAPFTIEPYIWLGSSISNQWQAVQNGPVYLMYVDTAGALHFGIIQPAGTVAMNSGAVGNVGDGGWHLAAVTMSSDGKTIDLYLDGALAYGVTIASDARINCTTGCDVLGGITGTEGPVESFAFVAELPFAATGTQMSNLYQAFRYAWGTNPTHAATSGSRYARVLGWLQGISGSAISQRVDTGATVSYGPAVDLQGGSSPTYALDALQNVVTSEAGQHFVAADGTVVFQARTERYNPTPSVTFGEHTGEVPYTNAAFDFDPTRVANAIEVDAQYGNSPYFAKDATSISNYGAVGLQETVNSIDANELQAAAGYLLYTNKQPLQRLEALPVDVGANPAVWASLLGLDLGTAVTVNRRPSNAPAMSQVGFVEQVQWTLGNDLSATWTAQVSNAALHYFGELDNSTYGKFDSTLILGF